MGGHGFYCIALCFILACSCKVCYSKTRPESARSTRKVRTENGFVIGKIFKQYYVFKGIPYAVPPLGELRFRPPLPAKPWQPEILKAFEFGPSCMQGNMRNPGGPKNTSEDCLTLNIWSPPAVSSWSKLPVMVWIYGGAFQQGRANAVEYMGDKLASKFGVVVVTLNYRVGALGFLVSVKDGILGNFGLQDQQLALEWVHRNIQNFGGNPNKVTLWGESAGAMSVGQHLFTENAGKKFQAVIMQSNPFGYRYRSITVADFIGAEFKKNLGCMDVKCLQSEPTNEIVRATEAVMQMPRSVGDLFTWGPVVKGSYLQNRTRIEVVSPVSITQPLQFLENAGEFTNRIPILLGTNRNEGEMFVYSVWGGRMGIASYRSIILLLFKALAPKVLKLYKKSADKYRELNDFRAVLSEILNDYMFRCPNWKAANSFYNVSAAGVPVYVYEFSFPTAVPFYPECTGKSCHTAELPFVFNQLGVIRSNYSCRKPPETWLQYLWPGKDHEKVVSDFMAEAWTHFSTARKFKQWPEWEGSKTGNWRKRRRFFAADRPQYLEIKSSPEVHFQKPDCTCQFWDQTGYVY